MDQWHAYVAALDKHGWTAIETPADDTCPDAVFIEDVVVMFGDLAVMTSPGAETRRPESQPVRKVVESLGYRLATIQPPATLDGGDVLKVGQTVYVGLTERTTEAGIDALTKIIGPDGYRVISVPTTKVLHLKSAVTALPDGTVIGFPPVVDDQSLFETFMAVPEESGSHVVDLGDGKLLMAENAPQTAELLASLGYEPVTVDISEFEKLEGCVTCLSVRLRTAPSPKS